MRWPVVSLVLTFMLGTADAKTAVSITSCGQTVPRGAIGMLAADLDCTGFTGNVAQAAVMVDRGSVLDLQGHTIVGALFGVACYFPCDGGAQVCSNNNKCTIMNGTVTRATASGITGSRITVRNMTVSDNGENGVQGDLVRAYDSTLSDNGKAGAAAYTVKVTGSTLTGNGYVGVESGRYNGNRHYSRGMGAKDSTITGNGTSPNCAQPSARCGDLASPTFPRLLRVTCGTSVDSGIPVPGKSCGASWCVCQND